MDELLNIGRKLDLSEVEPEVMIRESKPGGEIDWGTRAERSASQVASAEVSEPAETACWITCERDAACPISTG